MTVRLDEEALHADAAASTGLSDFGDPHYTDGLRAFIRSADQDAQLNVTGRHIAAGLIGLFLRNRLLLADERRKRPAVFERPLNPPVIIFGLPRTGTTLLHRMLALDPSHRAIPLWELLRPIQYETPDRRREIAVEGDREQQASRAEYDHVHYSRADTPEECVVLLATTFCSALFSAFLPVYGYAEWGLWADKLPVYREYRQLLQILQATQPSSRLVLKAPAHTAALPALLAVIPDALLVQTHRDPVAACVSAMSNCRTLQKPFVEEFDTARMRDEILHSLEISAARSLAFRDDHPGLVYDVDYGQLVADPVRTVRDLYRHFGLAWSEPYEEALRVYIRENPQQRHGSHAYVAADFDVDPGQIAARFAEYRDRFGFAHEASLT